MPKTKHKFKKKQIVRFTLVPSFDKNGKPITHFRPVETKNSKLNSHQRQKIIREISGEVYDQIEINGRTVEQNQIPSFILEQIKGRKDLVFNQKLMMKQDQIKNDPEGDLYDLVDVKDYKDDGEFIQQEKEWIEEGDIVEQQLQYFEQSYEEEKEGEDQDEIEDHADHDQNSQKQAFQLKEEEFPALNKVSIEGKEYHLTEAQLKLLNVLIPQDYQSFRIEGLEFEKYDEIGLPLSQKKQYQQFLATGNEGIVDSFDCIPETSTPIFDTDLKPSQITGQLREIQDALNFEGDEGAYQELEDDFFAKLVQSEISTNKKQKICKQKMFKKPISKTTNYSKVQNLQKKTSKQQKELSKNKENVFLKDEKLDENILEKQITDDMIQKALEDFQQNLEPKQKVKMPHKNFINFGQRDSDNEMNEETSSNKFSMSFSELQKCPQLLGKDGELDWRCLTKKQKKQYMKTKIIRNFYDEIRERQIEEKLKGKKNVTAEELHLKSLVDHLTFEEDHVMRSALQNDAKEPVDFDEQSPYQTSSEQEDIIQYRQRTSVISSNLNEISEPSVKKSKRKKEDEQTRLKQLNELSQTLSKLKSAAQKREKNETKEQRKQRKQKQKQLKKEKKEVKKLFNEKFSEQKRKNLKSKPTDPLHKVSYVKII